MPQTYAEEVGNPWQTNRLFVGRQTVTNRIICFFYHLPPLRFVKSCATENKGATNLCIILTIYPFFCLLATPVFFFWDKNSCFASLHCCVCAFIAVSTARRDLFFPDLPAWYKLFTLFSFQLLNITQQAW